MAMKVLAAAIMALVSIKGFRPISGFNHRLPIHIKLLNLNCIGIDSGIQYF